MQLATNQIETCDRIHVRFGPPKPDVVDRYKEYMQAGHQFPAIVVYNEPGTERYIVADGWHRLSAAKAADIESIEAEVRQGDEVDALEFALTCNADHGSPRTNRDLERAVSLLLESPKLSEKYRTHEDKADLLKISVRQMQRYIAKWRDSESSNEQEQKAKTQAKARAESHTPAALKEPDTTRVTSEPATDDGYRELVIAWNAASDAAQEKFTSEVM